MSFRNDLYAESEQRKTIENRDKVNVSLFSDFNTNNNIRQTCDICNTKLKLVEGGRVFYCRNCGKTTPIAEIKQDRRVASRFGSNKSGPMITSFKKRSKRDGLEWYDSINNSLSEEDKTDLREQE